MFPGTPLVTCNLSGKYSRDWSEYVNVIGVAILFAWHRLHFGPPARNRKKNRKNIGFGLPRKIGEKISRKIGKMAPKPNFYPFLDHFSNFSAIFFLFSGGGRNLHFSYFGLEARNQVCTRQTGSQDWSD